MPHCEDGTSGGVLQNERLRIQVRRTRLSWVEKKVVGAPDPLLPIAAPPSGCAARAEGENRRYVEGESSQPGAAEVYRGALRSAPVQIGVVIECPLTRNGRPLYILRQLATRFNCMVSSDPPTPFASS